MQNNIFLGFKEVPIDLFAVSRVVRHREKACVFRGSQVSVLVYILTGKTFSLIVTECKG